MSEKIEVSKLVPAMCMPKNVKKGKCLLTKYWQTFSTKGQIVNILGQTVSVEITKLHYYNIKEVRQYVNNRI